MYPNPTVRYHENAGISIVWLVPLVALAIGGWLVYKAVSEKGPIVTITFKSAAGLEAGKTKIKYKDVELGPGRFHRCWSEDISHVIVKAELVKQDLKTISRKTPVFGWSGPGLRPAVFPGSAPFFRGPTSDSIPGKPGNPVTHFQGLEVPPVVTTDLPGSHFVLRGLESWLAEHWRSGILPADPGRSGDQLPTGRRTGRR